MDFSTQIIEGKEYFAVDKKPSIIGPTRIAYIIGKMCAGGVEAVVFNYYRAIDHNKFQFDFYYDADSTVEPPQDLIDMGARFIKLPPYQRLLQYIKELRKHLRSEHYTIVHSHLNTLSVFPLYAAWKEHVPVRIAHNHSVPGGKEAGRNALKDLLRRFSRVFANEYCACSEAAGRWLFGDKLYETGRITVLKNAIDFSMFHISESIVKNKQECLDLNHDEFVVGHIGRFTAAKNHRKVIAVFAAVKDKIPNAVLLLVGDGEEREKVENWIKEYGVEESVRMTGKVADPQNYYPLINVLILPSVFEGVPVTIIESQIAGVPCVISDVVNKDVVISNGCKVLSPSAPDEIWADTIISSTGSKVVLNNNSKNYDINYAVKDLQKKYEVLLRG